jgi:S1/P1 Nuclease
MKRRWFFATSLVLALLLPQTVLAWNNTGHELVARIAWENMTPTARENVVRLMRAAPADACLRNLFPTGSRPLSERQREFFMLAATWPDIVRPSRQQRPCERFHRQNWHFVNFPWQGFSGSTSNPPEDLTSIPLAQVNIIERLEFLRPTVVNNAVPQSERATNLAWILHLAGDIHQPLHTSGRVTDRPEERLGDRGGNTFFLGSGRNPLTLHSYWDGIINRSLGSNLNLNEVAETIMREHPRSSVAGRLEAGQFERWARGGVETAQRVAYPQRLRRGRLPSRSYQNSAFRASKEAIAIGGYRLAELMNELFGS